ncbi:GNAT family N-acetyltransferase [Ilumatobacter sp.]|uniref:GNAT family N-acetyltransferase n=1 Tax=Ilumatobacter sp. TaxID=1967498 RepID=UPI00375108CB
MGGSDTDQIAAFEERFARAQTTDVIDLPWGFVLLQRDFPSSHDHNRAVVTSTALSADILSTVDDAMGGAGLQHRQISVIDDALGLELSDDFTAAGYERETITTMIYRGGPGGPPEHHVQEVSLEELRPALLREWKLLLPHSADDVHAQLADRIHLYARGAEVARLVVFEGPEIAARMDFYFDAESGITQLENLFTHPDFRGRGYAQSLINEGLRRGQNAGCRLAFLGADLDDWPHKWYLRLGFVKSHLAYNFTRL